MKKTLTILGITAGLFFGAVGSIQAQEIKVRYADSLMVQSNYANALEMYKAAYAKKPSYKTAQKTAEAADQIRDRESAYTWWKTVVGYEEAKKGDFVQLLKAGILDENFEEAQALAEAKGYSAGKLGINPPSLPTSDRKVKLENMEELNSSESDFSLIEDSQGNKYFVSDRGETFTSEMPKIRIDGRNKIFSEEKSDYTDREYLTVYKQDQDGNITQVVSGVPGTMNFADPSYAAQDQLLFYSVTRSIRKVKKTRKFTVQPEIFYSKVNADGTLDGFNAFPFNDSIGYSVMHPFVDEEANRLYFASDMPGGAGGYDLYFSKYSKVGDSLTFTAPTSLGSEVNTAGNETHPFRTGDKFYFSSDGHLGLGGLDIFQADYDAGAFVSIRNMGIPLNSVADDFSYRVGKDRTAYLSSNRKGGQGLDDIYLAKEMYKQFLAQVIDCNGAIITAAYEVRLQDHTQGVTTPTGRSAKGEITAELEPESDFEITISKQGYFSLTDPSVTTKGLEGDTVKRAYSLVAIPYQLPIYVDIVYYDLDRFVIRKDATAALDKLADLMKKYNFLDLLVASHTDARATDEYNIALSNNRAKAVTEYLGAQGISADRVRLEWFGESQLTNDCDDGMPCGEDNHQLNRRSELVLEAFSDPSKQYDIPQELKDFDFCNPEDIIYKIQEEINTIPTIYFDFDKSILRAVHKSELERTAIMLKRMPNLMLHIEGHTDQRGNEAYNKALSERRAQVVTDYLINRGVDTNRLESEWFGKTRPVHHCEGGTCTEAMHQLNRRTELRVGNSSLGQSGKQ